MVYLLIFISVLFFSIGIFINQNNAPYLLSGYNKMTDQERTNFDLTGYLQLHRRFFTFLAVSILFIGMPVYFLKEEYMVFVLGIYPVLAFLLFFYQTQKFNKNPAKWQDYLSFIILISSLILITVLTIKGFADTTVDVSNDTLIIKGQYGEEIPLIDIEAINIVSELPQILMKTNGFAAGYLKKGYFRTKTGERVKLFITTDQSSSFLEIIKKDGQKIYLATKDKSLEEIYGLLQHTINK